MQSKVQPFRFIRKSHFQSDLSEALEKYLRQNETEKEDRILTLEIQNEIYRFSIHDIMYIQSKDNYLDIVTDKNHVLIRYKISDMERLLESYQFLRIHKSYLVNYRYIYTLQGKRSLWKMVRHFLSAVIVFLKYRQNLRSI